MELKFCGLTRLEDILAANRARPDYVGFVFAESRRQVSDGCAALLRARLRPDIRTVGVFVNDDIEHIASLVHRGVIDLVQLHGDEDGAYLQQLRARVTVPVIRAVRVRAAADIRAAEALAADYLLLDTYVKNAYGGSGQAFDWTMIGRVRKPFFLAGGLRLDNIDSAMQTGAFALDLSGGIETNGKKDAAKMRAVAEKVRS